MKKNIKKITGIIAASALLVTSIMPFSVRANTALNNFQFSYATTYNGFITSAAAKQNSSSGSIRCTNVSAISSQANTADAAFKATMYGSVTSTGSFTNMIYNGNASKTYLIRKGTYAAMINYVNESGGRYAKIYAQSASGGYVSCTGQWQADTN